MRARARVGVGGTAVPPPPPPPRETWRASNLRAAKKKKKKRASVRVLVCVIRVRAERDETRAVNKVNASTAAAWVEVFRNGASSVRGGQARFLVFFLGFFFQRDYEVSNKRWKIVRFTT